jgi:hypothetical protein
MVRAHCWAIVTKEGHDGTNPNNAEGYVRYCHNFATLHAVINTLTSSEFSFKKQEFQFRCDIGIIVINAWDRLNITCTYERNIK